VEQAVARRADRQYWERGGADGPLAGPRSASDEGRLRPGARAPWPDSRGSVLADSSLRNCRARELLCAAVLDGGREYGTSLEDLDRYFLAFAV